MSDRRSSPGKVSASSGIQDLLDQTADHIASCFELPDGVADRLAERYNSPDEVREAPPEELRAINGIGEARLFKIKEMHSDALWEVVRNTDDGRLVPIVTDTRGVRYRPEEFDGRDDLTRLSEWEAERRDPDNPYTTSDVGRPPEWHTLSSCEDDGGGQNPTEDADE